MATKELMKTLKSEEGIAHAALTMAVAILVERIKGLPKEDRGALVEEHKQSYTDDSRQIPGIAV